jgi:hypothetical protein
MAWSASVHIEAIGTKMKKTVKERLSSGLPLFLVPLIGLVASCAAPSEPNEPAISAQLAGPQKAAVNAWSFARPITINHGQVPNTDQINFPVLVSGLYKDLRTKPNGGKVQNASGYDVGFYTDPHCLTGKLSWETEKYTAQTGEVVYWVEVPLVSHTKNTVFYMCYGNASITTDQSAAASVWDSNYLAVWHLADNGGLVLSSSTANDFTFTNSGPVISGPGKIGGGTAKFLNNTYYLFNGAISVAPDAPVTVSMWKKLLASDSLGNPDFPPPNTDGNHISFAMGANHDDENSILLWAPYFGVAYWCHDSCGAVVSFAGYYDRWVYITGIYDPAANQLQALYLDGKLVASGTNGAAPTGTILGARIGQALNTVADPGPHGEDVSAFDEIRISTTVRSADWIKTEFNNQNKPSTFYAVGGEKHP